MKVSFRPLILALTLGALSVSAVAVAMPHGPGCSAMGHSLSAFAELHDRLKLTPEQEALWIKAANADKAAREEGRKQHEARRAERGDLKKALAAGEADLHALVRQHDEAMAAGQQRMQRLRDQWLTVYDSLDAGQKRQVQAFLAERVEHREGDGKGGHHSEGHRPTRDGAPSAPQPPATR